MNKQELVNIADDKLAASTFNDFKALGFSDDKIWAFLDMGIAAGDDSLFSFFKEDIGDFYWTPSEAFRQVYPDAQVQDSDLSVLSFGFYMDEKIKAEQRLQKEQPCMRWMYARNNWRSFIQEFAAGFVGELAKDGIRVASLEFIPNFGYDHESEKYGRSASWSYRHAAYVAGQGTFGLSENFISRYGVTARYSSIIVETKLIPDEREYDGHHDWCTYYVNGGCRACLKRCPMNAIYEDGHNKTTCHDYAVERSDLVKDVAVLQPISAFWCGLCQAGVPCQNGIPKAIKRK